LVFEKGADSNQVNEMLLKKIQPIDAVTIAFSQVNTMLLVFKEIKSDAYKTLIEKYNFRKVLLDLQDLQRLAFHHQAEVYYEQLISE